MLKSKYIILLCMICIFLVKAVAQEKWKPSRKSCVTIIDVDPPTKKMAINATISFEIIGVDTFYICKGIVHDSTTSKVMTGVSVIVINSSMGCATNLQGEFELHKLKLSDKLRFQSRDYITNTLFIKNIALNRITKW